MKSIETIHTVKTIEIGTGLAEAIKAIDTLESLKTLDTI